LHLYSRIILTTAGVLVALGGAYDLCAPRLPENLARTVLGNRPASIVVRELLRALGAGLVAIGAAVAILARCAHDARAIAAILILVVPSESVNAVGMRRVGSPYIIPLLFVLLTVLGASLALVDM
jgi:hypothetical protein